MGLLEDWKIISDSAIGKAPYHIENGLIHCIETILEETEWAVLHVSTASNVAAIEIIEPVVNRFGYFVAICHILCSTPVPVALIDSLTKLVTKLFKTATQLTKVILATKDDECLALFKTVALSIGQTLKKAVYDFFAHSRRVLDEQKSKTMLKKESKSKPQLVFEMETFEGHLIELSEKTQTNLMSAFRRS